MRRPLTCLLLALPLAACNTSPKSQPAAAASATDPEPGWTRYGGSFGASERISLQQLLATPGSYSGKTVTVEGEVRRACSRKGCWMELAESADAKSAACRVTFKDYGFFVPLDSAGSRARLEAVVQVENVKPAHVEHLEEEGASFAKKNADGTADEVRLVASVVDLRR